MIAQLVQISGEQEATNFITHLSDPERGCFFITLFNQQDERLVLTSDTMNDSSFIYQKTAIAPDGLMYLISYQDSDKSYGKGIIFNMPIPLFLMGIAGGLLFSLFLAWPRVHIDGGVWHFDVG